jgi:DNA-binding LytR/AlgR family response regulator
MTARAPTALIADDEPLLRESLARLLAQAWPELDVVAQVRNGRLAVETFEALKPDICFLDVHMPGLSGVEAARFIGRRAHVVFVTAFDRYAVQAFDQGALDYLVKPVELARLADTVGRLKERLRSGRGAPDCEGPLDQVVSRLGGATPPVGLRWLRVAVGQALRVVAAGEVDFLRSEDKYTLVAWRGPDGEKGEGLVRTPLKDLAAQLDPERFVQIHRSVVVNLGAVERVMRGANETAVVHVKGRVETLPVSRSFLHHFRMM